MSYLDIKTPTVICKDIHVPLAMIPLPYNIIILINALSLFITHVAEVGRKLVEVAVEETNLYALVAAQSIITFKQQFYKILIVFCFFIPQKFLTKFTNLNVCP